MTPQDFLTTAQPTKSWRSGDLHHPGWRATRVFPGQYPQYTRAPKVGGGCGYLAKHYTYMSPITKGLEGPFTTFPLFFPPFFFFFFFFFFYFFLKIFSSYVFFFSSICIRGRCSMEMWCPDDIGRDSWEWVGPPAWWRARFNSPEWGGGSSPVKTEPPQIVFLFLFGRRDKMCDVYPKNQKGTQNASHFGRKRGATFQVVLRPMPRARPTLHAHPDDAMIPVLAPLSIG